MSAQRRKTIEVVFEGHPLPQPVLVGHLHFQPSAQGGVFSFEYAREWLDTKVAFDLDPGIARGNGLTYAGGSNFGIFLDSSPDRWGRTIMERHEIERARREGRPVRALTEFDFLIGVNDETRIGALRFRDQETGEYLSAGDGTIPVTSLNEIMDVARHIEERRENTYVSLLVAPGSSLGGARPKANYVDSDGNYWIAKFPSREDRYDVAAFERLAAMLAERCGIRVPESKLLDLGDSGHRTFCIKRFDRDDNGRRHFYMSAMTAAGHTDNEGGSYLDIAQCIMDHGASGSIDEELEQLYRRMVLSALVGNIDDHLRNHGFIATETGITLSPAFDINPSIAREAHAITFDGATNLPDMQAILDVAPILRISPERAHQIITDMARVIGSWKELGRHLNIDALDLARMEPAFGAHAQVGSLVPAKTRKRKP